MVVFIKDHVEAASTQQQGHAVHSALVNELTEMNEVVVSFKGVAYASSSFVNACFVAFLDVMSLEDFKNTFRIVDSKPEINKMIRDRLTFVEFKKVSGEAG